MTTQLSVVRADTSGPGDYRSIFVLNRAVPDARAFAVQVFAGAPSWFRLALRLGWRLGLGLRLDGPRSTLGWELVGDAASASLTADGGLLQAVNEVQVEASTTSWTTTVFEHRRAGRWAWAAAAPLHHRTLPWLLTRAAKQVTA